MSSLEETKDGMTEKITEGFDEESLIKQCEEINLFSGKEESDLVKEITFQKAAEYSKEKMVCNDRVVELTSSVMK